MYENMIVFVIAICLHLTSATENAIQVILGGSWLSKSSVGTSGSRSWRNRIFNPLVTTVAQKVMENMIKLNELHWLLLGIVLWNSLLTIVIFYKSLKNLQCRRQNM